MSNPNMRQSRAFLETHRQHQYCKRMHPCFKFASTSLFLWALDQIRPLQRQMHWDPTRTRIGRGRGKGWIDGMGCCVCAACRVSCVGLRWLPDAYRSLAEARLDWTRPRNRYACTYIAMHRASTGARNMQFPAHLHLQRAESRSRHCRGSPVCSGGCLASSASRPGSGTQISDWQRAQHAGAGAPGREQCTAYLAACRLSV